MLREVEDERLKLQEDRARAEIAKTLQSRNADDLGLSRAEIDASVKYAEVNNTETFLLLLSLVSRLRMAAKDADPMNSTAISN